MTENHIKRHPDGSIDYDFYRTRGRAARSEQAHSILGSSWKQLRFMGDIVALTAKWSRSMTPRNIDFFTSRKSHA